MTARIEKTVIGTRDITIFLPPAYNVNQKEFAVVYMQDGGELVFKQVETISRLMAGGKMEQLIFVGIAPEQRLDDYTPWPAVALTEKYPDFGGRGQQYLAFVVNEVKAYVETKYRTRTGTEHTGIIGASLGGLISLYALYLYPQVFGKAGSFSGSFWYEGFVEYINQQPLPYQNSRIYLDVGSQEGIGKKTAQREMLHKTSEVYQILLNQGITAANCRYSISAGDTHGQRCFMRRFPAAVNWLFPMK